LKSLRLVQEFQGHYLETLENRKALRTESLLMPKFFNFLAFLRCEDFECFFVKIGSNSSRFVISAKLDKLGVEFFGLKTVVSVSKESKLCLLKVFFTL
jgi:hypothetical protein